MKFVRLTKKDADAAIEYVNVDRVMYAYVEDGGLFLITVTDSELGPYVEGPEVLGV